LSMMFSVGVVIADMPRGSDKPEESKKSEESETSGDSETINATMISVYDFDEVKKLMVEENLIVFSPTEWIYDQDATFDFFVRTPSTALRNIFLDEQLLTKYHKDFIIEDQNNGIFLIRISSEIMEKLPAGEYNLLLQLRGPDDITETIQVK